MEQTPYSWVQENPGPQPLLPLSQALWLFQQSDPEPDGSALGVGHTKELPVCAAGPVEQRPASSEQPPVQPVDVWQAVLEGKQSSPPPAGTAGRRVSGSERGKRGGTKVCCLSWQARTVGDSPSGDKAGADPAEGEPKRAPDLVSLLR